jgi:nucleoid DNA-binding protein
VDLTTRTSAKLDMRPAVTWHRPTTWTTPPPSAAHVRECRPILASQLPTQKPLNSNKMTKQQLIEQVAAKTEMKKSEAEVAVDSVLALIAEALRANERVDLRGFGSFVVKERKERQGRNPRTGEAITIAAKRDASFKPGKELTEKLAQADTAPTPEDTK